MWTRKNKEEEIKEEKKYWRCGNIKRQENERTGRIIFIIKNSIAIKKLKRKNDGGLSPMEKRKYL